MRHRTAAAIGLLVVLAAGAARADVVTNWNVTTNALVANVGNNGKYHKLAMVHVAMSDAINTVQNRYTRVVATLSAVPDASAEAAAAAAAREIAVKTYPDQQAKIDEACVASLNEIPDGPAKTAGIKVGMQAAAAVQADRANDGTDQPDTYRPQTPELTTHDHEKFVGLKERVLWLLKWTRKIGPRA